MSLLSIANEVVTVAAAVPSSPPAPPGPWVPNTTPAVPTEVQGPIQTVTSWVIGIGIALAVALVAFAGGKIMLGRTGRSSMGADGVTAIGWVITGITVIIMSGVITRAFL